MTILVVDDDPDFRHALAENLRDDGFEVFAVDHAPETEEIAGLGGIDLVVADYHLPARSGLELADAVHRTHPRTPVVLVTADPSPEIAAAARARPYLAFRTKPIEYCELRNVIRAVVPRR